MKKMNFKTLTTALLMGAFVLGGSVAHAKTETQRKMENRTKAYNDKSKAKNEARKQERATEQKQQKAAKAAKKTKA